MELSERKIKILKAIIKTYMESGEPVGSRTLSKMSELKVSSATIRNEMSDLEEMDYIVQPHTSAGRIPTDRGYRFYVDEILKEKANEIAEFKTDMASRIGKLELVLKQLAKMIATNTSYATMISGPKYNSNKIKFVQLSKIEENKLLIVTVVEGNIIKNKIIDIEKELLENNIGEKEIFNLNLLLNTSISGLSIEEINLNIINKIKLDAKELGELANKILSEMALVFTSEDDLQIYTSGTTNFFKYPELADSQSASELIGTFEEKDKLRQILTDKLEKDTDNKNAIQVYIGEELPIQNMKDCSVVTANYELGQGIRGTIGIVGPKRMDYEKVLKSIQIVMEQLDEELK